jgi:hypothetical protein
MRRTVVNDWERFGIVILTAVAGVAIALIALPLQIASVEGWQFGSVTVDCGSVFAPEESLLGLEKVNCNAVRDARCQHRLKIDPLAPGEN